MKPNTEQPLGLDLNWHKDFNILNKFWVSHLVLKMIGVLPFDLNLQGNPEFAEVS